jgi:antitoxin HicB
MQRFTYPVTLTPDEKDGGFVVTCRDVPELVTQGETTEDAISEAEGALRRMLDPKHGTKVPPWSVPCMRWASGLNWW